MNVVALYYVCNYVSDVAEVWQGATLSFPGGQFLICRVLNV